MDCDRTIFQKKLPIHIISKFQRWAEDVEFFGMEFVRKIPGYHDELLAGDREGQRSIRLSKAYRAFYVEEDDSITVTEIEVNKHVY